MKLVILRNHLLEGLTVIERAIGDNVNLPILKNFLFRGEDEICLISTNLELAIKHILPGKIIEKGEITIPFFVFKNIISNLNSERITIEQKEKQLFVNTENYEAVIQGQSSKEYPIIPLVQNKEEGIKIESNLLKEALSQIVIATQYSEIRPEISGVFLFLRDGALTLVATDSFRLAEKKIDPTKFSSESEKISVIIPLKTAQELLRILKDQEEMVSIYSDVNQIVIETKFQQITSRLIVGNFPEYQAIIPNQTQMELTINRQEFLGAIKLTSAFSGRANDITLRIGENKKFLELYSSDSTLGENRYRVPIKLKGERFSTVFNWRYLLDGLKIYRSEEVVLGVNAADRPTVIKSLTEPHLVYVVMPIKS